MLLQGRRAKIPKIMNRSIAIISVLSTLAVGLAFGYILGKRGESAPPKQRAAAGNVAEVFRQAARQSGNTTRQDCLQEKLGPERYAALVLNPNAATTEDQFKILPCPST